MVFCTNCGNKLDEESMFCSKCGTKVDSQNNNFKKEVISNYSLKDIKKKIKKVCSRDSFYSKAEHYGIKKINAFKSYNYL